LLAKAGLVLRKAAPGKAWAGALAEEQYRGKAGVAKAVFTDGLLIQTSVLTGTPVYKAGLDAGDVILKADGQVIKTERDFETVVASKKIGDKVIVDYENRTGAHQATVVLEEDPKLEVLTFEKAGKELSKDEQDFRNNWLLTKVK